MEIGKDLALELRTKRLLLAPLAIEHASELFALMRDGRITTFLAWAPHAEEAETKKVVASLMRAQEQGLAYHWTIFEGNVVCGLVSLIDVQRQHRLWTLLRAEIAYWIDPGQQGRGLATEATAAVLDFAFQHAGLHRIRISHVSENPASGRVPQKLGFRFIGTEREFFKKNGAWHDMNHYEMLAQDWHDNREKGV